MGGMICRLMITDAGEKIWRDFFATPPAKTPLAPDTRKLVEETLVFNHRPELKAQYSSRRRIVAAKSPRVGSADRRGSSQTPQRFTRFTLQPNRF